MVLQVGAVRHRLPEDARRGRGGAPGVEQTGRTALTEMRRLLGAMRQDGDDVELAPQPGLDGLDSLVEEVGRAGLPVRLHVDGERCPLPRAIDLSAYRIVQEGLTNALKHARASRADVDRPLRGRTSCRSRCATTASAPRRATASATGSSASASASRSTAAR